MLLNRLNQNISISLPILFTRLIGLSANLITMIVIAKLGIEALSSAGLITSIFGCCFLFLIAFNFPLTSFIAENFFKSEFKTIGAFIQTGLILNALIILPFFIIFYFLTDFLIYFHQKFIVSTMVGNYFKGMMFGLLPMLWTHLIEQLLIATQRSRYILYCSILNLVTLPIISFLITLGKFGFKSYGMFGAGLAVSIAAWISFIFLIMVMIRNGWHKQYGLTTYRVKKTLIKKIFFLGLPTAIQFVGEFFAYMIVTLMMGWVSMIALAAQQIILQLTSVIVMFPASISQALTVLVAKQHDKIEQVIEVKISLVLMGIVLMCTVGIYFIFNEVLISIYLDSTKAHYKEILALAKVIMWIALLGMFFESFKTIIMGALRAIHQTKAPMLISLVSLWLISIPISFILGFTLNYGAIGIRLGFILGGLVATLLILFIWKRYLSVKISAVELYST